MGTGHLPLSPQVADVPDAVPERRQTRRARPIVDLAVVVVVAPPPGIVVDVLVLVMRHIGAAATRGVLC
jgi:hypothetical protein